jgi:hydroxypyruvate isomerase
MKYSICIEMLCDCSDAAAAVRTLERVREAGFSAFEFWGWENKDLAALRAARDRLELSIAAMCTEAVPLNDPAARPRYLEALRRSCDAARSLGCPTLITLSGQEREGVSREAQHESIVQGLRAAAPIAGEAGLTLVLEPLNTKVDHAGYYLAGSREGLDIVDEVGSPAVKLLYDIYHMQVMEGDLISTLTANVARIGHLHAAGVPGRHEVTGGEIAYGAVFQAIAAAGYDRYCGLEYSPSKDVAAGLRETMELIRR